MNAEPQTSDGSRAVARLFGVLLMVVGILFMSLGGLCAVGSLLFTLIDLTNPRVGLNGLADAIPVFVFGAALPIAIGYGAFALGRRLNRDPKPPVKPAVFD